MPYPRKYASHAERQAAYRKRTEEAQKQQREAKGLPDLPVLAAMPGTRRWRQATENIFAILTMVESEMNSYYEERSQTWQEGEQGDTFQERLNAVTAAVETLAELTEQWT